MIQTWVLMSGTLNLDKEIEMKKLCLLLFVLCLTSFTGAFAQDPDPTCDCDVLICGPWVNWEGKFKVEVQCYTPCEDGELGRLRVWFLFLDEDKEAIDDPELQGDITNLPPASSGAEFDFEIEASEMPTGTKYITVSAKVECVGENHYGARVDARRECKTDEVTVPPKEYSCGLWCDVDAGGATSSGWLEVSVGFGGGDEPHYAMVYVDFHKGSNPLTGWAETEACMINGPDEYQDYIHEPPTGWEEWDVCMVRLAVNDSCTPDAHAVADVAVILAW
jgi:hypothetical protein